MSGSRSWRGVRDHGREAAGSAATAVPISLLVVERMARAMQRRGGVLAAIGLAGVPVAVMLQIAPGAAAWAPAAILWTIVACVGLRGFFVARGVLAQLERSEPPVSAVLDGSTLILRREGEEMHLNVSALAVARLGRHAVPMSIVRT